MAAESMFEPITQEAVREARARLLLAGQSIEDWAVANGFKARLVYQVLRGSRPCIRGRSLQIAQRLGLRPSHPSPPPDVATLPLQGSIGSGDRRPALPLGEPLR